MNIVCNYPIESFTVALFAVTHLCYYMTFRNEYYINLSYVSLVEFNNICLFLWTYMCTYTMEDMSFQPHYMFLLVLWADFWTYCSHRILHTRLLFKYIHSIHHQRNYPQPFDSFYCHPFENFFQNWCIIGLPILMWPISGLTIGIMGTLFILNSLKAHESREEGFHATHHKFYNLNYGAGFHLMDKFFKTYMNQYD